MWIRKNIANKEEIIVIVKLINNRVFDISKLASKLFSPLFLFLIKCFIRSVLVLVTPIVERAKRKTAKTEFKYGISNVKWISA